MGLPGKRLSRSSKRRRASHFALSPKTLTECKKCKKSILPHRACAYCGTYKGRDVIKMKTKATRQAAVTKAEKTEKTEEKSS